eukprot:15217961-Alexandrium_andersonii.AAC.1
MRAPSRNSTLTVARLMFAPPRQRDPRSAASEAEVRSQAQRAEGAKRSSPRPEPRGGPSGQSKAQ